MTIIRYIYYEEIILKFMRCLGNDRQRRIRVFLQ